MDGKLTVSAAEGVQTLTATDRFGNTVTVTFTVNAQHTEGEGKITTPATTEREGVKTYACTVCGQVLRTESVTKLPAPGRAHHPRRSHRRHRRHRPVDGAGGPVRHESCSPAAYRQAQRTVNSLSCTITPYKKPRALPPSGGEPVAGDTKPTGAANLRQILSQLCLVGYRLRWSLSTWSGSTEEPPRSEETLTLGRSS